MISIIRLMNFCIPIVWLLPEAPSSGLLRPAQLYRANSSQTPVRKMGGTPPPSDAIVNLNLHLVTGIQPGGYIQDILGLQEGVFWGFPKSGFIRTQRQFLCKCSSSFLAGSCPYATRYHEKTKGELSSISHFFNFWDGYVSFGLKVLCVLPTNVLSSDRNMDTTQLLLPSPPNTDQYLYQLQAVLCKRCWLPWFQKFLGKTLPVVIFVTFFCPCHAGPRASVSRLKAKGWRRHWSWHEFLIGKMVLPLGSGPLNNQPYIHLM